MDSARAVERLARALRECDGVRLAFLFGSRARGRARADSDFDRRIQRLKTAPTDGGSGDFFEKLDALRGYSARLRRFREVPEAEFIADGPCGSGEAGP